MKKVVFVFFASIISFFYSCTPVADCERTQNFTIRISSDSYDAYALYVDDKYVMDMESLTYADIQAAAGTHYIELVQLEGFHNNPNTESYHISGEACDFVEVIFPD